MDIDHSRDSNGEVLTFSPPMRPVLIFFAVVSAAVVLAIALTLMIRPVSYTLLAVLLLTGALVGRVGLLAIELMTKTTVRLDASGLHIDRLIGSSSHPWEVVDGVKMIPSMGSLADDPRTEARGRLGLGLFLKGSKKQRAHALDPDEVIITASDTYERLLDRMAETVAKYQARQGHGGAALGRGRGSAPAPATFRRQSQPAGAPAPPGKSTIPARARGGGFGQRER
jgi:hypothetical protein